MTGVQQRVIFEFPVNLPRARINQQLRRVKAMPLGGLPGAMNAITITQTRTRIRQITVPNVATVPWQVIAMFLAIGVKDTQLYPLGMSGEKCEVDALTVVMRAEGSGFANGELCHSASRTSQIVASGGSVRLSEC